MKMNVTRYIFIGFVFLTKISVAQDQPTVSTSIDKNKLLIGEPVRLVIEVSIPASVPIRFAEIDSIDHFEFLKKPEIDTSNTSTGTHIKGVYTITSFDSGHWVIPPYFIADQVTTDSIPMDVVFADFNPEQAYHDIKDIEELPPPKERKEWWYTALAGLLLLLLIAWLLLRKKKKPLPAQQQAPVDPYEEALRELKKLKPETQEIKEFYTNLSAILRLYLYRKKGILSLQKTTDDLVLQLRTVKMDAGLFNSLSQSLRLTDYVKFAKYQPSADDNRKTFETIKNSIDSIEQTG